MLNPFAKPFYPRPYTNIGDNENQISTNTYYDDIIDKICCFRKMFPGSEISDLICEYSFYNLKGIIEKRRSNSLLGDPLQFQHNFINNMIKSCRYVNDNNGRYMFNSAIIYKYFEVTQYDDDNETLELKTKMKSIWLGPTRFCLRSGDYAEWCNCETCKKDKEYVIVFSDSDEDADINF